MNYLCSQKTHLCSGKTPLLVKELINGIIEVEKKNVQHWNTICYTFFFFYKIPAFETARLVGRTGPLCMCINSVLIHCTRWSNYIEIITGIGIGVVVSSFEREGGEKLRNYYWKKAFFVFNKRPILAQTPVHCRHKGTRRISSTTVHFE